MEVSQDYIERFKQIYLKDKGIKLNNDEAKEKFLQLIFLFKLIYKPIPLQQK